MSKDNAPKKDDINELKIHAVKVFYRQWLITAVLVGIGVGIIGGWFIHANAMGDAASVVKSLKA